MGTSASAPAAAGADGLRRPSARPAPRHWCLRGAYAPVEEEAYAPAALRRGRLPEALRGAYCRNGPNRLWNLPTEDSQWHWFFGDGMVHTVRIAEGAATYHNHWLRTGKFVKEQRLGQPVGEAVVFSRSIGHFLASLALEKIGGSGAPWAKTTNNTSLVFHHRKLLALCEADLPLEVRILLDGHAQSAAAYALEGDQAVMNAHPRIDPESGVLHWMNYDARAPRRVEVPNMPPHAWPARGACSEASTDTTFAPEVGDPAYVSEEPLSLLGSREMTPATLGFFPLTREATPLHSYFTGYRHNPMDLGMALQKLSEHVDKGSASLGEEDLDMGTRFGNGDASDPQTIRLTSSGGQPFMPPFTFPEVPEEAPEALLDANPFEPQNYAGSSALLPPSGSLGSQQLFPEPPFCGDLLGERPPWSQHLTGKDDFYMNFLGTPECTPLHPGFVSPALLQLQLQSSRIPPLGEEGQGVRGIPTLGGGVQSEDVQSEVAPFEVAPFAPEEEVSTPPPPVPDPPLDDGLPSVGSAGHPLLCARPCKYSGKPRGCKDGKNCVRCHLCSWRRAAEKQASSMQCPHTPHMVAT